VDGDVNSAEAVTHTRVAETQIDGTTIIKHVLESLDSSPPITSAESLQTGSTQAMDDQHDYEQMANDSRPHTPRPRRCRVRVILAEVYIKNKNIIRLKRTTYWNTLHALMAF
jgi:hypothetical protein